MLVVGIARLPSGPIDFWPTFHICKPLSLGCCRGLLLLGYYLAIACFSAFAGPGHIDFVYICLSLLDHITHPLASPCRGACEGAGRLGLPGGQPVRGGVVWAPFMHTGGDLGPLAGTINRLHPAPMVGRCEGGMRKHD
jgi:hypothetical protein